MRTCWSIQLNGIMTKWDGNMNQGKKFKLCLELGFSYFSKKGTDTGKKKIALTYNFVSC